MEPASLSGTHQILNVTLVAIPVSISIHKFRLSGLGFGIFIFFGWIGDPLAVHSRPRCKPVRL